MHANFHLFFVILGMFVYVYDNKVLINFNTF